MESVKMILPQVIGSETTYRKVSPREYEQSKVDSLNNSEGTLYAEDGYNCSVCKNKGYIINLQELPGDRYTSVFANCRCMEVRNSIKRMKKSGLGDIIREKTFDRYEVVAPWHQTVKDKAVAYAKEPKGWFFVGGQSGAGKTHICTAICREFLLAGRQVVYMLWMDDVTKIQNLAKSDPKQSMDLMNRFKETEVLYIDDLFKPVERDGSKAMPNAWDIKIAFEILNYRSDKRDKLTIISSEWTQDGLLNIDEATGGRIFEQAGEYGISIAKDLKKNYRLRKAVTV